MSVVGRIKCLLGKHDWEILVTSYALLRGWDVPEQHEFYVNCYACGHKEPYNHQTQTIGWDSTPDRR